MRRPSHVEKVRRGSRIEGRFKDADGTTTWYSGTVVDTDGVEQDGTAKVVFDDGEVHPDFDLCHLRTVDGEDEGSLPPAPAPAGSPHAMNHSWDQTHRARNLWGDVKNERVPVRTPDGVWQLGISRTTKLRYWARVQQPKPGEVASWYLEEPADLGWGYVETSQHGAAVKTKKWFNILDGRTSIVKPPPAETGGGGGSSANAWEKPPAPEPAPRLAMPSAPPRVAAPAPTPALLPIPPGAAAPPFAPPVAAPAAAPALPPPAPSLPPIFESLEGCAAAEASRPQPAAARIPGEAVRVPLREAEVLMNSGHYTAATELLEGLLTGENLEQLDEKDVALASAQCLHMQGRDDDWISMMRRAAELDTRDSALQLRIGDALFDELEYADALAHFDAALALLRTDTAADAMAVIGARKLSKMALCAFKMDDAGRSKGLCRHALALERSNVVAKKLLQKIQSSHRRSKMLTSTSSSTSGAASPLQVSTSPRRRGGARTGTLMGRGSVAANFSVAGGTPTSRSPMGGGGAGASSCVRCVSAHAEVVSVTTKLHEAEARARIAEQQVLAMTHTLVGLQSQIGELTRTMLERNRVDAQRVADAAAWRPFALGTRVSGRFEGVLVPGSELPQDNVLWFPGTVQSYNAGEHTYDILFDDGERHPNFDADQVVAYDHSSSRRLASLELGSSILAADDAAVGMLEYLLDERASGSGSSSGSGSGSGSDGDSDSDSGSEENDGADER